MKVYHLGTDGTPHGTWCHQEGPTGSPRGIFAPDQWCAVCAEMWAARNPKTFEHPQSRRFRVWYLCKSESDTEKGIAL